MTRGHGWAFLDLGRRLERGAFVARVMDGVLRSGADLDLLLEPALEIGDSVMTHRRRYFAEPRLASTMEVMVWDTANPRSLAFQIKALENHAATLPTGANPEGVMAVKTRIRQLAERLGQFQESPSADLAPATNGTWQAELLTGFAAGLGELSDLVTQVYFSHVSPQVS